MKDDLTFPTLQDVGVILLIEDLVKESMNQIQLDKDLKKLDKRDLEDLARAKFCERIGCSCLQELIAQLLSAFRGLEYLGLVDKKVALMDLVEESGEHSEELLEELIAGRKRRHKLNLLLPLFPFGN